MELKCSWSSKSISKRHVFWTASISKFLNNQSNRGKDLGRVKRFAVYFATTFDRFDYSHKAVKWYYFPMHKQKMRVFLRNRTWRVNACLRQLGQKQSKLWIEQTSREQSLPFEPYVWAEQSDIALIVSRSMQQVWEKTKNKGANISQFVWHFHHYQERTRLKKKTIFIKTSVAFVLNESSTYQ